MTPSEGQVVRVRQRHYLVNRVTPGLRPEAEATLVELSCLDDDSPGEPLQVLWELEVDGEILPDEPELLRDVHSLDDAFRSRGPPSALRLTTRARRPSET